MIYKDLLKIYGIYKLTSPSGKVYIGQTYNLYKRLNTYRLARCKQQRHLYNAIIKYGFENFIIEILFKSNYFYGIENSLNHAETYFINLYDSIKCGYNIRGGGENNSISDETKLLMSKAALGRKFTDEHKSNLSKAKSGIKLSEDHINKIIKSNTGKKRSKESIANVMAGRNLKSIYKYSLNGKFIEKYDSISIAASEINIHRAAIETSIIRNGTCGGYVWKYEYLGDEIEVDSKWTNTRYKKVKRNGSLARQVLQFDLDGNFVAEHPSVAIAASSVRLRKNSLSGCLNGKYLTSRNYKWIYKYPQINKK